MSDDQPEVTGAPQPTAQHFRDPSGPEPDMIPDPMPAHLDSGKSPTGHGEEAMEGDSPTG